ncbi:MAG: hypothetical protein Q8Q59_04505 [Luteolibacter sp.]|nr:hypothetical protein [Luteolibacter sp.]
MVDGFLNDRQENSSTPKIEPGNVRDIMCSYGVTFEAPQGETPQPGDVPAPAPGT